MLWTCFLLLVALFVPGCIACTVGDWSEWGECSVLCGRGTQARIRARIIVSGENPDDLCPPLFEERYCIGSYGCFGDDEPPLATETHKIRQCAEGEDPRPYLFYSHNGTVFSDDVVRGFTCYRSPCPAVADMDYNTDPCFNKTATGIYTIADLRSAVGFFSHTRAVIISPFITRHCSASERTSICGNSTAFYGCMVHVNRTNASHIVTHPDSACNPVPVQAEGAWANATFQVCPAAWVSSYACYADERRCLWSDRAGYTDPEDLVLFKCPWNIESANWTTSNEPPATWSDSNAVDCTFEESVQQCGAWWASTDAQTPCRKRITRYNELGGHTYEYDIQPCMTVPCSGPEQISTCGNYSHMCFKTCDEFGRCTVNQTLSTCLYRFATLPARTCTVEEASRTCADLSQINAQCAVRCSDDLVRYGCNIYTRCIGDSWVQVDTLFARPFRVCSPAEYEPHGCSPVSSDCVVECDDVELSVNCSMSFKCPTNSTSFYPTVRKSVYTPGSVEQSTEQCGDAWADDSLAKPCTLVQCEQLSNGSFAQCRCDVLTCSCPFSYPEFVDGETEPCALSYQVAPCPRASPIAQQVCGINTDSCVANCTGFRAQPVCTAPDGIDAQCTCLQASITRPLFGLECNGRAIPCTSEEFRTCGPTAVACDRVTEFTDTTRGVSTSLNDPDRGATSSYILCHCHAMADNVTEMETDTGDTTRYCGWDELFDDPPDPSPSSRIRPCNSTESTAVCLEPAATCVSTLVATDCSEYGSSIVSGATCAKGLVSTAASPVNASYAWYVVAGTCRCDPEDHATVYRPRSEQQNGVVCYDDTQNRECTTEEEAALRIGCEHPGGECEYTCEVGAAQCSFDVAACYGADNATRDDCSLAERVHLCGVDASECEVRYLWDWDANETEWQSTSQPMIVVEGTQVCDIGLGDIISCSHSETRTWCKENGAIYLEPNRDAGSYRPPFFSRRHCLKIGADATEPIPGTCPMALSVLRTCNTTEVYMYCGEMYSSVEDATTDPPLLAQMGCLLACPPHDNATVGDRESECRRIGLCTRPSDTQNVSNPAILADIFGDMALTMKWCVVRMIPHPENGTILGYVGNPATDCEFEEEYFAYFDRTVLEMEDDGGLGPASAHGSGYRTSSADLIGPVHHETISRIKNPRMHAPAHSHVWHAHGIHDHDTWKAHVHGSRKNVHHSHSYRGPEHHDVSVVEHYTNPEHHHGFFHSMDSSTTITSSSATITVERILYSTNASYTASCGPPGSTLTVGVVRVFTDGVLSSVEITPRTCVCNFTAGWYASDDGESCIQFHIRNCTLEEASRYPSPCTSVCRVRCTRTRIRNDILFGAETCFQFEEDTSCFGVNRWFERQELYPENVRAICGPIYGLRGTGRCRYTTSYPIPGQVCEAPLPDTISNFTSCQCSSPDVKYPRGPHQCGSDYVIRTITDSNVCKRHCGVYGLAPCSLRCTDRTGNTCYAAHACGCSVTPPPLSDVTCMQLASDGTTCNLWSHCGVGRLSPDRGGVIAPTCDPMGLCGPLTLHASINCVAGIDLREACDQFADTIRCQCKTGAADFNGAPCWGFTRKCEPRELEQCVRSGVCRRAQTPYRYDTSCDAVCSSIDRTRCSSYANPSSSTSDPLQAHGLLIERGIEFVANNFTPKVYVLPSAEPLRVQSADSLPDGTVPCTRQEVTAFCGDRGQTCRMNYTVDGAARHVRDSCVCTRGSVHYRSLQLPSGTLPDGSVECYPSVAISITSPCTPEERWSFCGVFGVQSCTARRSMARNATTGVIIPSESRIEVTCSCFQSVMSAQFPENSVLFTRTGSYFYSSLPLKPHIAILTVCHPAWQALFADGLLGTAHLPPGVAPSDVILQYPPEHPYRQVADVSMFQFMNSTPYRDTATFGACPISLPSGLACSGRGRCLNALITTNTTSGSWAASFSDTQPMALTHSGGCIPSSVAPNDQLAVYYTRTGEPITRDPALLGRMQRIFMTKFSVYLLDIWRRNASADFALWANEYASAYFVEPVSGGAPPYFNQTRLSCLSKIPSKTLMENVSFTAPANCDSIPVSAIFENDDPPWELARNTGWLAPRALVDIVQGLQAHVRRPFWRTSTFSLLTGITPAGIAVGSKSVLDIDPSNMNRLRKPTRNGPFNEADVPSYYPAIISRIFSNPLDSVVAIPSYGMKPLVRDSMSSFTDDFPVRYNGYCALQGVPMIYQYKSGVVDRYTSIRVPFDEYRGAPLEYFYPLPESESFGIFRALSNSPVFSYATLSPDSINVSVIQTGEETFRVPIEWPAGHPFGHQWRILTGGQVRRVIDDYARMSGQRSTGLCAPPVGKPVLNAGSANDTSNAYGDVYRWKRNIRTSTTTATYCHAAMSYLNAIVGRSMKEPVLNPETYYFGADQIGPLVTSSQSQVTHLVGFSCILGPGLPPPVDNPLCQTAMFRTLSYIPPRSASIRFNGTTFSGPKLAVGGLSSAANSYKCYMLRNVNPVDQRVGVPCTQNACECAIGYAGPDCSLFIPDTACAAGFTGTNCNINATTNQISGTASRWAFPIWKSEKRCWNGTHRIVSTGNGTIGEKCVCDEDWSLFGGVCVWHKCKNINADGAPPPEVGPAHTTYNLTAALAASKIPLCSAKGSCSSQSACLCARGYSGAYCQRSFAENCPKLRGIVCGGRGVCVPNGDSVSGAVCVCHNSAYGFFTGTSCGTPVLRSGSVCNTTNGGVVSFDPDTLDVYCNCTNTRYTGPSCTIDKCPSTHSVNGTVCGGRSGYGCFESRTVRGSWECRPTNDSSPAADPLSESANRWYGCALETDLAHWCGTSNGLCGRTWAEGRKRCIPFVNATTQLVEHRCECSPGDSGDRCDSNVCMNPSHVVPRWNESCHDQDTPCDRTRTLENGGGCKCPSVVPANGSLFTGQYCQYNVTSECGILETNTRTNSSRMTLCSQRGRCVCSGILDGVQCFGGSFGCVCDTGPNGEKYGGSKCEGYCLPGVTECANINLCPQSCGEHGYCALVDGVYRCVCRPGVKYGISNVTGDCTRDRCASGEDAFGGTIPSRPDGFQYVDATVDPDDPTRCVCRNPLMDYDNSRCTRPLCPRGPRGWICGDPLPGWLNRINSTCYRIGLERQTPEQQMAVWMQCDENRSPCTSCQGITRRCFAQTGECSCSVGYIKNTTSGLCQPVCHTINSVGVSCGINGCTCVCAAGFSGTRCDSAPCPTTTGRAVWESANSTCRCVAPWIDDPETGTPCSTRFCNSPRGSWNSTLGECVCRGVYTGARCTEHMCGDNGEPHPTNRSRCVCDPGWAGTRCEVPICPTGVARFIGVNETTQTVICQCENSALSYLPDTRTCNTTFEDGPTDHTSGPAANSSDYDGGSIGGVENTPVDKPSDLPNATVPADTVKASSCEELVFNNATHRCACESGDYISGRLCSAVLIINRPTNTTGSVDTRTECLNGGIHTTTGECNCTYTQHWGDRCQWPLCANGCRAVWSMYTTADLRPRALCWPSSSTPSYWSRNFSDPVWNCTRSLCGPGGTPVNSTSAACTCRSGYFYTSSQSAGGVRCVRPCNSIGTLYYHPETGSCVCRPLYSGSQCQSATSPVISASPRHMRVDVHQARVFYAREVSFAEVAAERFKNISVWVRTDNFSIPDDLVGRGLQERLITSVSTDWYQLHVPDPPPKPREPSPPRVISVFDSNAAVALMSVISFVACACVVTVSVVGHCMDRKQAPGYQPVST